MTQALINSLNIVSEKVNLTNKMSKSSGMDFGKLFENKTGEINKNNTDIKSIKAEQDNKNTDTKPVNTNSQKQPVNEKNTTDNTNTDTDINTDKTTGNDSTETNESNTTETAENNTQQTQDTTKTQENKSKASDDTDENEAVTTDESYTDTTVTEEDTDSEEEITVTEEEPTMYNELITLDDIAALLMFQSQIQKTVTVSTENEQTTTDENSTNTKNTTLRQNLNNTDTTTNKDTEVLKQFDAQIKKGAEIINRTPAETTRSKIGVNKPSNVINESIIKELNVEVLSSQSADTESSMGDLMQNQSPQEQAARVMIQGDIKYESVASEVSKNITPVKTTTVAPGRIIEQITKQLETMFNNSKLNMVVNPGSIGKLSLQLVNTKDGILAQFTVTTQEARDAIMKGLSSLKESLLANGVNIDNVSVKLENSEGETENDYTEQEGSKGGYKRQGEKRQKEDGKNFEEMMFSLENEGNV